MSSLPQHPHDGSDHIQSYATPSINDFTNNIGKILLPLCNLRTIHPFDFSALIQLERRLFPGLAGIFDTKCLRSISEYAPTSIVVGLRENTILSYVSAFPLCRDGFKYFTDNHVTTICRFPIDSYCNPQAALYAVFLEVIAVTPDAPANMRIEIKRFVGQLINCWSKSYFLSCPVTEDGIHLLQRRNFRPVAGHGLNQLYIRKPTG